MKTSTLILFLALFSASGVIGQSINLLSNWDYRRKAGDVERIRSTIATTHGYLLAVGETASENYRDKDGLVALVDALSGEAVMWKRIGGVGDQSIAAAVQNPNGTFTLVGSSKREEKESAGWLLTIDSEGNVLDEYHLLDGTRSTALHGIAINSDGICLIAGTEIANKNAQPFLLTVEDQLASARRINKNLPGAIGDLAAINGDFFVMGTTSLRNREHPQQIWLQRMSDQFEFTWPEAKFFGDHGLQEGLAMAASQDGIALAGVTNSRGAGEADMWIIHLDDNGEEKWQKTFGGKAADIATSICQLSGGGYGILGYTWSHMPRAKKSSIQLILVDQAGALLDDDIFPIVGSTSDNISGSLVESFASQDLVICGNTDAPDGSYGQTLLSSVSYQNNYALANISGPDGNKSFSEDRHFSAKIGEGLLIDQNRNAFLEKGERAYLEMEVSNDGELEMDNVTLEVSGQKGEVEYWEKIYLGSIKGGAHATARVPLSGTERMTQSQYDLDFVIKSGGKSITRKRTQVMTNEAAPANLIVNQYLFTPDGGETAPGDPITLSIELTNIGGSPTNMLEASFDLPVGVHSRDNERRRIPELKPRQTHTLLLTFDYREDYADQTIKIGLETTSTEQVVGLKKTFSLPITAQVASSPQPMIATSGYQDEIFWTHHEEAELRAVDVTRASVQVKALAVSSAPMAKKNFALYINGRRAQGHKIDETRITPPKEQNSGRIQQSYLNKIHLDEGMNEIQLAYLAEDGETVLATSSVLKFNYVSKGKPNLHVISIGVQHDDLQYTASDARDFAAKYARLRDEGGRGFKHVNVIEMIDSSETSVNSIRAAFLKLSRMKSIKEEDLVVVFISSHGKVVDGDRYILLPSDYNPGLEEIYSIDFKEDILKKLRTIDAHKLVFIDACHSGSAGSRSFSDEAASKVMNDLISSTSGMEIFASCGDREFSYEDASWQNGAFTKAILEAFDNVEVEIDNKRVRADVLKDLGGQVVPGSDGVITIEELKNFVQQRVPHLVKTVKNKPQNPRNKSTELLPRNMGIYMVNK